jgi:type IV secretory pathway TrbD component
VGVTIKKLAWLLPLTYLLHIAEEYWGGFPEWMSHMGVPFTQRELLILNGIGLVAMIVAVSLPWRWVITTLAGIVFLNGMLHAAVSLVTRSYSPGLATGVLLWIPLGLYILIHELRNAPGRTFASGLIGIVVFHVIATLVVMEL